MSAVVPVMPVPVAPMAASAPAVDRPTAQQVGSATFSQMLLDGVNDVNRKAEAADSMVRAFALDDSIPVHQVTYALEEAQGSLELALQVRARLLEGYQQLMNMQL